jgi:hypothetical protein
MGDIFPSRALCPVTFHPREAVAGRRTTGHRILRTRRRHLVEEEVEADSRTSMQEVGSLVPARRGTATRRRHVIFRRRMHHTRRNMLGVTVVTISRLESTGPSSAKLTIKSTAVGLAAVLMEGGTRTATQCTRRPRLHPRQRDSSTNSNSNSNSSSTWRCNRSKASLLRRQCSRTKDGSTRIRKTRYMARILPRRLSTGWTKGIFQRDCP